MPEETKEVRTLLVEYKCPKCGKGYLIPGKQLFQTDPPRYPHACNNPECNYGETFNRKYPYTRFEVIKNTE